MQKCATSATMYIVLWFVINFDITNFAITMLFVKPSICA